MSFSFDSTEKKCNEREALKGEHKKWRHLFCSTGGGPGLEEVGNHGAIYILFKKYSESLPKVIKNTILISLHLTANVILLRVALVAFMSASKMSPSAICLRKKKLYT